MNLLVCFDVDGTLETSNGPVTLAMLRQLQHQGAVVAIVSPSDRRPRDFPEFIDGLRHDNLLAAAKEYPATLRLYVSDNGDREAARLAGFIYVDRNDFRLVEMTAQLEVECGVCKGPCQGH